MVAFCMTLTVRTLGSIASKQLVTVNQDDRLEDAAKVISARHLSALVVVDRSQTPVGLLSTTDIVRHAANVRGLRVAKAMTHTLFTLDASTPVAAAARILAASHLHRIIVTEQGKIVGLVSLTDIVRLVGEVGLRDEPSPNDALPSAPIDMTSARALFGASLARCGPKLVETFYTGFLSSSPEVQKMFENVDMEQQQRSVAAAFQLAIDVSRDPGLREKLNQQAEIHDRHHRDVGPELYEIWVNSLVAAVQIHDPEFSPVVEQAWRLMLGNVASYMLRRY